MSMLVMKFGGTSVGNPEAMTQVMNIISNPAGAIYAQARSEPLIFFLNSLGFSTTLVLMDEFAIDTSKTSLFKSRWLPKKATCFFSLHALNLFQRSTAQRESLLQPR